jgi:hypothetical protein
MLFRGHDPGGLLLIFTAIYPKACVRSAGVPSKKIHLSNNCTIAIEILCSRMSKYLRIHRLPASTDDDLRFEFRALIVGTEAAVG